MTAASFEDRLAAMNEAQRAPEEISSLSLAEAR
jgi:hypothetical protein